MSAPWPKVAIGEVAQLVERTVPVSPEKIYRQVGVRLWGKGAYERESVAGVETRYTSFNVVRKDDIIVNKIWACNGSIAVVPKTLEGCYCSGEFPIFAPNLAKLDPRWFHWYTMTSELWNQCAEKSFGTSGKTRMRPDRFLEVQVPLPPIAEQKRIVARLEELAAKAEEAQTRRANASMQTLDLADRILTSAVERTADRHALRRLGDLILNAGYGTSIRCGYDRPEGTVPVLRIPNIASEHINLNDLKYGLLNQAELEGLLLAEGDVAIVRTNGSRDLVGRCAVVPQLSEPTSFASYLIRLRCDIAVIDPRYLQHMLRQLRVSGQLFDFARTTAGQYNVSLGRLRGAQIPVPPLAEQRSIVTYLDRVHSTLGHLQTHQSKTSSQIEALLPAILERAFKGGL